MKTARRGLGKPKTMRSKVVDRFKARTPQGALAELTRLTQEKGRLRQEMERWEERLAEIQARLKEVAEMEAWLYRFVERPGGPTEAERDTPTADGERPTPAHPDLNEMTIRY